VSRLFTALVALAGCYRPDARHVFDEPVTTAPGWTVEVWRELQPEYAYDPNDWIEDTGPVDNAPGRVFAVGAPMEEGLVVTVGRAVLMIDAGGAAEVHAYRPPQPDQGLLPDNILGGIWMRWDLPPATAGILLCSGSNSTGDGVFQITPEWGIDKINGANNLRALEVDAEGRFDAIGDPQFYATTFNGVLRLDAAANVLILNPFDLQTMRLLPDDDLLLVEEGTRLWRVTSVTHALTLLGTFDSLVLGDGRLPEVGLAYAVADGKSLVALGLDAEVEALARTESSSWRWIAASVPAPPHALAEATGRTAYVLESNRTEDRDRILKLTGP
jgi:hypothetical protein